MKKIKLDSEKVFWGCIWCILGIMISIIISFMLISDKPSLERIYDVGRVCDIFEDIYQIPGEGMEYLPEKEAFQVTKEGAYKYIGLYQMEEDWRYIILELSKLNVNEIPCQLILYNNDGVEVGQQEIVLCEGKNEIELTDRLAYSGISFVFYDLGVEFYIDDMQFRMEKSTFSWEKFIAYASAVMLVYFVFSILVYMLWIRKIESKLNAYVGIDGIQQFYGVIGERCSGFANKLGHKTKSNMRILLFAFMITYMQVIMNLRIYEDDRYYKCHVLICVIIIFIVAMLCRETKLEKQNWKNKLVGSWYILWIMACVSDFIVRKRYMWVGYMMIFFFGLLFYMWNNMENKQILIKEWMTAIKWNFILNVIFCLLCRPEVTGIRYIGGYYNPGMFAMHLLFVWLVLLQDVDEKMGKEMKVKYYLPEIIGSGILLTLLWKTQSASGILPAGMAFFVFGLKQIIERRKGIVKVAFAALVLGIVVSIATSWGINTIPHTLNTEVKFEGDEYVAQVETPIGPVKVYAGDKNITESRIYQKLFKSRSLESFTTRRSVYWMGYLRGMNIFGNENKEYLWGRNRWPHNGFVAIAYRYGVFAVIPYTIMVISVIFYSWIYLRQQKKYGLYIFSVSLCSFILILMENLELPFLFLCWFSMYLMMGILFEKPIRYKKLKGRVEINEKK